MLQTVMGLVAVARSNGPSLSNSSTDTSLLQPEDKYILRGNTLALGRKLKLFAMGRFSNIVTTPGTFTFSVRFGSVAVWSGGAVNFSTTAHTTLPWWLEVELTCRAVGNSTNANMMAIGRVTSQCVSLTSAADGTATMPTLLMPNSAPAVGTGFDSTADNTVDLYGKFSIGDPANLCQLHDYSLVLAN